MGREWNYEVYNRPNFVRILKALRLDVEFVRGAGDYLYYHDDDGKEAGALDLAGGMGATILGHNHPKIKETIADMLSRDVPMHAQGSVRESAGRLSEKLSSLYPGKEKRIAILTNTGTEAVECALKHAEMNRMKRLMVIGRDLLANHREMKRVFSRNPHLKLPDEYRSRGAEALLNDVLLQGRTLEELPPVVIAMEKAYHGKTTGSLSVTGNLMYREAFSRMSGIQARFVEFNNSAKLEAALDDCYFTLNKIVVADGAASLVQERHLNVTALVMETVQGEGGIHLATDKFVRDVERLRGLHGFEWIVDDIQSGMGRTGKFFSIEHFDVDMDSVDYVLMSKALGGGTHKLGAMLVRESIHDTNFGMLHTSTFGEDSPSCEVAIRTLELLTENDGALVKAAGEKGSVFLEKLEGLRREFPRIIRSVRGKGLMIGVEFGDFKHGKSIFFSQMAEQGGFGMLLTGYLFHEHHIRTSPPLNSIISHNPLNIIRIEPSALISYEDIDRVIAALRRACEIASKANAYELCKFVIRKEQPGACGEVEDCFDPADPPNDDPEFEDCRRMAFQFHPLDVHQVMDGFDRSLSLFSRDKAPGSELSERELFWDTVVPMLDSFVLKVINLKSPRTGDRAQGILFGLPYTTRQMLELRKNDPQRLIDEIQRAGERGAKMGALIYGLGAFNSICTHDGLDLDDTNIAITSGNSYTSALIWQSILKVAEYAQMDLNKCTAAIVGGAGNIGSVTANLLSEDVPKLILVGSQRDQSIEKLRKVAAQIYSDTLDVIRSTRPEKLKGLPAAVARDLLLPFAGLYGKDYLFREDAVTEFIEKTYKGKDLEVGRLIRSTFFKRPDSDIGEKILRALEVKHGSDPYIVLTTELKESIEKADIVVSAVSSDRTIMDAQWFKPGSIVNDVSLPTSISDAIYKERPDVIAFEGGVGHLPEYVDLGIPGLVPGATLGCVAETFMLTLMNMVENYSCGPITKKQVTKIWEIGNLLGFGLGGIKYQVDKKLTRAIAQEIMKKSRK